jgi:hypothetical protein
MEWSCPALLEGNAAPLGSAGPSRAAADGPSLWACCGVGITAYFTVCQGAKALKTRGVRRRFSRCGEARVAGPRLAAPAVEHAQLASEAPPWAGRGTSCSGSVAVIRHDDHHDQDGHTVSGCNSEGRIDSDMHLTITRKAATWLCASLGLGAPA